MRKGLLAAPLMAAVALPPAAGPRAEEPASTSLVLAASVDPAALLPSPFDRAGALDLPSRLTAGESGRAVLDRATWEALQPPQVPADPKLPGPAATFREVDVEAIDGALLVHVLWRVEALEPGWLDALVAGPDVRVLDVRWDGGPAAWDWTAEGARVAGLVTDPVTLELHAELPGDAASEPLPLSLLPAARGELRFPAPAGLAASAGGQGVAWAGGDTWWTGSEAVLLALRPSGAPADRGTLALGSVGIGLTTGDTEIAGRARVVWTLRRGQLDRLSLRATGLGDDLRVTGPGLREVSRSGDRIDVVLQAPVRHATWLDLSWSTPLPAKNEASVDVPVLEPGGVSRSEASLQIARNGDWEALPDLPGWTPSAGASLPEYGRDLVEGTPTAAFLSSRAGRPGEVALLRFEPVSGPPVMIDLADVEIATSAEGRALVRVRYEVVNDRGAFLEILPPFGSRFLTVRADEEAVEPVRSSGGGWRIPLPRSLETIAGLISVPVEVVLLAEGEPWGRREARDLPLPRVDAPVAASRVTLYLPPGYREVARGRDPRRVEAFSEGEGIGWGLLAEGEEGHERAAQADLLFKDAVDAWMGNDFEEAQATLDALAQMGASNVKTGQLQSNLDLIFGDSGDGSARNGLGSYASPDAAAAGEETDSTLQGSLGASGEQDGAWDDEDGEYGPAAPGATAPAAGLPGLSWGRGAGGMSGGGAGGGDDLAGDLGGQRGDGSEPGGDGAGARTRDPSGIRVDEAAPAKKPQAPRSSGEEALRRRVREQARARAEDEYREYEATRRQAAQALEQGDYEAAERDFRRAQEVGRKLEMYEQDESAEVAWQNEEIDRQLAEVAQQKQERESRRRELAKAAPEPPPPPMFHGKRRVEILFDSEGEGDDHIYGAVQKPDVSYEMAAPEDEPSTGYYSYFRGSPRHDADSSRRDENHGLPAEPPAGHPLPTDDSDLAFGDLLVDGALLVPASSTSMNRGPVPSPLPLGATVAAGPPGGDYPEGERGILDGRLQVRTATEPVTIALPPASFETTTASITIATAAPGGQALAVTAASHSVPIPRIGEPLRFQQLLLPAHGAITVLLRARLPSSEGTLR